MTRSTYACLVLLLLFLGCGQRLSVSANSNSSSAIYDEKADAGRDIAAAVANARASNRHIVLIFGANWCPDCHALDAQMHKPELASIIKQNFVIVHIDVGGLDKNVTLAEQYHVPIARGIPALAVLDRHSKLLFAADQGQFSDAREMSYDSIKAFFLKWEPKG